MFEWWAWKWWQRRRANLIDEMNAARAAEIIPLTFEEAKWYVMQLDGGHRWVKDNLVCKMHDYAVPVEPYLRPCWDAEHTPSHTDLMVPPERMGF
jgi:hypothetical protein